MKEILISQLIKTVAAIPIAYIVLRMFFKKSILLKIGIIFVINILSTSFISTFQTAGYVSIYVSFSLTVIIATVSLFIVTKLIKEPLQDAINKVVLISKGKFDEKLEKVDLENEIGILNNSLIDLSNNLLNIITNINVNSENLFSASQQLSSSSEQLSQGLFRF